MKRETTSFLEMKIDSVKKSAVSYCRRSFPEFVIAAVPIALGKLSKLYYGPGEDFVREYGWDALANVGYYILAKTLVTEKSSKLKRIIVPILPFVGSCLFELAQSSIGKDNKCDYVAYSAGLLAGIYLDREIQRARKEIKEEEEGK